MWRSILILWLLFSANVNAEAGKASTQTLQLFSSAFKQDKTISVRLPADFSVDDKQRYPVIYVLNANSFYLGNVTEDITTTVSQLEVFGEIPKVIVVSIESENWYQESIGNPEPLNTFLAKELPMFIASKFPVTDVSALIGHSYTGAYIAKNYQYFAKNYQELWAISPIFPDIDFVKQAVEFYASKSNSTHNLVILVEPENVTDVEILQHQLSKKAKQNKTLNVEVIERVSHFSILPVAMTLSLRRLFSDYQLPNIEVLLKQDLTFDDIKMLLAKRAAKYGITSTEGDEMNQVQSIAQDYMRINKIPHALALWQKIETKFKHYFINRWGDRYLAKGDIDAAKLIWQNMSEQFPNSPYPLYKLQQLGKQLGDNTLQAHYQSLLAKQISQLNVEQHEMFFSFAQYLIEQGAVNQGIELLRSILSQDTTNSAVLQRLADEYQKLNQTENANKMIEQLNKLSSE